MLVLLFSALSVGVVHTLLGPDHYLPFIVLAKSRNWSATKTSVITLLCGVGHILSAAVLGIVAVSLGFALSKLNFIESFRGEVAAWLLIGFGFAYFLWGIRYAIRNKKHDHRHLKDRTAMDTKSDLKELTPWILFVIFVLGPCEPLIPLLMYPAIQYSLSSIVLVTLFFSVGTLLTMLFMVLATLYGANRLIKFDLFARYSNSVAGVIICGCGVAIKFLGI